MSFIAKKDRYGFGVDTTIGANNNYMAWISGGEVTVDSGLDLDVAAGEVVYQGGKVSIVDTSLTIVPHATLKRRDLIVYNGTAVVIVEGTASDEAGGSIAKPADIDPDTQMILALVVVEPAETSLQASDIIDYRVRGVSVESGYTQAMYDTLARFYGYTAQTIFNAAYMTWDPRLRGVGAPSFPDMVYDIFTGATMTISGNMVYDATNDLYFGPTKVVATDYTISWDECNDSVVDLALWSPSAPITPGTHGRNAAVTENTSYMQLYAYSGDSGGASANVTSVGTMLEDGDYVNISIPYIEMYCPRSDYAQSVTLAFGGTTMWTQSYAISGNGSISYANSILNMFRIGDTVYWAFGRGGTSWTYGVVPYGTGLFYANVSANDYGSATYGRAQMRIDYVRYNNLATSIAAGTDYITSAGYTADETITNCIPVVNTAGEKIIEYAANGVDFEAVNNIKYNELVTTGTNPKIRIKPQGAGVISEYAVAVNVE